MAGKKRDRRVPVNGNEQHARSNPFPIYRTYHFSGQDPAVQDLLSEISDFKEASEATGVARSTFRNWQTRKTRRPKFATMQAAAMGVGLHYVLRRITRP
jgi:hypothetical protein